MSWQWPALAVFCAVFIYYYMYSSSDPRVSGHVSPNSSYDYIIVGAGTAGCVLATRLSEHPDISVLLLEAGGSEEDNPVIRVPFAALELQNSDVDWAYRTESQQKACLGMHKQRCAWPRGKVLGGSGSINNLIYVRGNRHDYDGWAKEGCEGWSYKDVLPYFIKSEDIQIPELMNSAYHGKGGPLPVKDGTSTPLAEIYRQAMKELGYPVTDCNGRTQTGYCPTQENVLGGERWSTVRAFLRPAMNRPNLHVIINAHVTKILIDKKTATGVSFVKDNIKHTVQARKEVVLTAGAINNPQLLMLSGIGPKKHLQQMHIPVMADLPVGDNLQDHILMGVTFNDRTNSAGAALPSMTTMLQYLIFRSGTLSKTHLEGSVFFKDDENQFPSSQFTFYSIQTHPELIDKFIKLTNLDPKIRDGMRERFQKSINKEIGTFFVENILLHPKSRGTIRLQTTDPFDPPLIDPNYLDHPDDAKVLLKGIDTMMKLANTTAFRSIGASPNDPLEEYLPPCNELPFPSKEYWVCRMTHYTYTVYHPTSTCRMGTANDVTAVVDPQLRVIGIKNLRISDASVMRNIPSGNTNAPTIMIAEKAADLILGIDSVKHIRKVTENL